VFYRSQENETVFCRLLSVTQLFRGGLFPAVHRSSTDCTAASPRGKPFACRAGSACQSRRLRGIGRNDGVIFGMFCADRGKCVLLTPTLHEGRKHCGDVRGGTFSGTSAMGGLENNPFALPTSYRVWIRTIHRQLFGPDAARRGRIHYRKVCN
jgi:hypothetical protein